MINGFRRKLCRRSCGLAHNTWPPVQHPRELRTHLYAPFERYLHVFCHNSAVFGAFWIFLGPLKTSRIALFICKRCSRWGVGIFLPKMTRRLSKQALKVVSGLCQSHLRWLPREGPDPALVCSREKNTVNKVVEHPKLNGEERI